MKRSRSAAELDVDSETLHQTQKSTHTSKKQKNLQDSNKSTSEVSESFGGTQQTSSATMEAMESADLRSQILRTVYGLWGLTRIVPSLLPCPDPVPMTLKDLETIQPLHYRVSLKSDGKRCVLLMMTTSLGDSICVMMDRKCNITFVKVIAVDEYYKGTLLDGELVHDPETNTLHYWVFDCVAFRGHAVREAPYLKRLEYAQQCFGDGVSLQSLFLLSSLEERTRQAERLACSESLLVFVGNTPEIYAHCKPTAPLLEIDRLSRGHANDGYILHPIHEPVGAFTQRTLFKFKVLHTLDFGLDVWATPDGGFTLWCLDGETPYNVFQSIAFRNTLVHFQLASSPTLETIVTKMREKKEEFARFIVECEIIMPSDFVCDTNVPTEAPVTDPDARLWDIRCRVLKVRLDKSSPNSIWTIVRTLENIHEGLGEMDFLDILKKRNI